MVKKILFIYYSHSGNTEKIAEMIQGQVGGALQRIEPEIPYTTDYKAVVEQAKKEIQSGLKPALKTKIENIASYDVIFIGSPNWWNTIAPPIASFLTENNLDGKKIIPFYTHGGGGAGNIEKDIKAICQKSDVLPGLSVYGNDGNEKQIADWLDKIGIRE